MKFAKVALAFLTVGLLFSASSLMAEDFSSVTGYWKTIDDETGEAKSIVHLYETNGELKGRIIKLLKDPDAKCDKCPGDSNYAKNTPITGMVMIWGVKELGEKSGYIFDPAKAKRYTLQLWKEGKVLKVRGYVAFFYRTQTWYPAKKP